MIITSISGFFPLQPSGKTKIKPCQEHTLTLSTVTTCFTLTPFRVMEGKVVLKQWLIPWYVSLSFSKERQKDRQANQFAMKVMCVFYDLPHLSIALLSFCVGCSWVIAETGYYVSN